LEAEMRLLAGAERIEEEVDMSSTLSGSRREEY
jgi:hypothetical protein